jgi:hypothetical protein
MPPAAPLPLQPRETEQPSSEREIRFVSVVLPCLDEEAAVGPTVEEALRGLRAAGVDGEVIVVDNGSSDRSVERARAAGARVIEEPTRGYGAAHLGGIAAARGDVIVMADADQTYDLERLARLLEPLRDGADLVVMSRLDEVGAGAMPFLHRYVGTPVITRVLRLLTGVPIADSQSGYRAFWRDRIEELDLRAPGMEYASEMLLKAARAGFDIRESSAPYRARVGDSKLHTLRDGWRHIRMLLILSPHLALIVPGLAALGLGLIASAAAGLSGLGADLGAARWVAIFGGPALALVGAQAVVIGAIAAERSEFTPAALQQRLAFVRRAGAVDRLLARALALTGAGVALSIGGVVPWVRDRAQVEWLALAGLGQAVAILGATMIFAVLSASFAAEGLWSPRGRAAEPSEDAGAAADETRRAA